MGDGPDCLEKGADLLGNRRFESTSLQQRVGSELPVVADQLPPPVKASPAAGMPLPEWVCDPDIAVRLGPPTVV